MATKAQDHCGVSDVHPVSDHGRAHQLARIMRSRLLAYFVIAIAVAGSFQLVNSREDRRARRESRSNAYATCIQVEAVKAQANQRIQLLREVQYLLRFKGRDSRQRIREMLDSVTDLVPRDCKPILNGK